MQDSLGLIEVSALGNAIMVADRMLKTANVRFVATERKLGGRLVTIVIQGELSAVTASVEAGQETAKQLGCLKAAEVIARPHPEIFKFLHLGEEEKAPEKVEEKKEAPKSAPKTTKSSKAVKAASDKKPSTRGKKTK
ncbi:MAG: BMC domain-containing protein [Ruminococcaceae bacterium]|nr:BMC domain-containing protein [Oscillospiraceae bacterium]